MSSAIELEDLRHSYDGEEVLRLSRLSIAAGACHLVSGASGCGKTTLLHVIAGLLRPSHGSVRVVGREFTDLPAAELDRFRARHLGIVFQQLHLMAPLSALENVLLARYLAGLPQREPQCLSLLEDLGVAHRAHVRPTALSRGEAQRVALARALANEPEILLADEPTASLDDTSCQIALSLLLEQARTRNVTLLVATHDARVREHFADVTELSRCS